MKDTFVAGTWISCHRKSKTEWDLCELFTKWGFPYFLLSVSTSGCDVTIASPSLQFRWTEGGAVQSKRRGTKQGRAHKQSGLCRCVFTPPLWTLELNEKGSWPCWWGSQHGDGRPRVSSREHGAAKDLWLYWVQLLGEDRLRWIWTSIQSTACEVENMAGYQVPSLSSCGRKVSDSSVSRVHLWTLCVLWWRFDGFFHEQDSLLCLFFPLWASHLWNVEHSWAGSCQIKVFMKSEVIQSGHTERQRGGCPHSDIAVWKERWLTCRLHSWGSEWLNYPDLTCRWKFGCGPVRSAIQTLSSSDPRRQQRNSMLFALTGDYLTF